MQFFNIVKKTVDNRIANARSLTILITCSISLSLANFDVGHIKCKGKVPFRRITERFLLNLITSALGSSLGFVQSSSGTQN